jgi:hypothetical protein
MDHEIDKQEPSGKEGGQVKVGDKVWVLCEVAMVYKDQSCLYMDVHYDGLEIQAKRSDCRPVEPPTKEPTRGQKLAERTMKAIWAANDAANGTPVVKHGDPSGGWEPTKDEIEYAKDRCGVPASEPLQVGDAVRFVLPRHERHGTEGVVSSEVDLVSSGRNYWFESNCGQFSCYCTASQLERINQADPINPSHYKQGGIECIEAMKVALGGGFFGYLRGNAIKYLWRYDKKNGVEDLKKARWYLDRLIKEVGE